LPAGVSGADFSGMVLIRHADDDRSVLAVLMEATPCDHNADVRLWTEEA
jgi:hypothetical protein